MTTSKKPLSVRNRFLFGGMGGIAPVLMNLVVIDLETLLINLTVLAIFSYLIRVLALFSLGGLVAILNRDESNPLRLFQLGIAAPALITALVNGSHITVPEKVTTEAVAVTPTRSTGIGLHLITPAYAQPPAKDEVRQFSLPQESPAQQVFRGFFGALPKNVWFVIAGSHQKMEDAERQAQQIRAKNIPAEVYAPYGGNPYFAVVIGAQLTRPEAQEIRDHAIKAGLPNDTYLWTFPAAR